MPRLLPVLAIAALCACEGATFAALRVEPPPGRADAPLESGERALLAAVRDAVAGENLSCQPGRETLLECRAAALTGKVHPSVTVRRQGSGYAVEVQAVHEPWTRTKPEVCRLARRLASAIDASVNAPVTHAVSGTDCDP